MTASLHTVFSHNDVAKRKQKNKQIEKQATPDEQKLKHISELSSRVLLDVSGLRPFDLFPDHLVIDESKITVTIRHFIQSGSSQSFPLSDVRDVVVEAMPFYATLKITINGYKENPLTLGFLPRDKAYEAKRLIYGLQQALKQQINISQVKDIDKAKEQLVAIGKGA
jgi:hypothetical protein